MRVQSFVGVPPEIQAYAMAKYSRSQQGMAETIKELSQDRAAKFLETFYFQYGHRSIADLAHLTFGVEDISMLAAIELEDEPLWDGQERSSRYQDFSKTGWVVPIEVQHAGVRALGLYNTALQELFTAYYEVGRKCMAMLVDIYPVSEDSEVSSTAHMRALQARSFDIARYLLPLASKTSVGQIVSARTLEKQCSRLMGSDQSEIRELALILRDTASLPAETPLCDYHGYVEDVRAAPTLVKYVAPSAYELRVREHFERVAGSIVGEESNLVPNVVGVVPVKNDYEMLATLLFHHDPRGRSYQRWIYHTIWEMKGDDLIDRLQAVHDWRGPHDELLRDYRVGYPIQYDLKTDIGAYRDLHRHRRCVQIRQKFTFDHGYLPVHLTFIRGLGVEDRDGKTFTHPLLQETEDLFERALDRVRVAAELLPSNVRPYMLPLGYFCRSVFKMDPAEAAYIAELRTKVGGHFSYRRVAWEMYEYLIDHFPQFAQNLDVTDPTTTVDLLNR